MAIWPHVAHLFAGALTCNAIPHLANGLSGRPFPTPFARPPGVGLSSSSVNVLWGSANALVGAGLLLRFPIATPLEAGGALFAAGFVLLGLYLSRRFSDRIPK
ncbi:MAG TPA: hypothetical protein VGM73_06755 [Candidatus Didemnitutus sp.]|jgi:hypothetical protein